MNDRIQSKLFTLMEEYISTMAEERIPVNVRVDRATIQKIDSTGRSRTEVVTDALDMYFLYDRKFIEDLQEQLKDYKMQLSVMQARYDELEKSKELLMKMYENTRTDNERHVLQAQTLINHIQDQTEKKKKGFLARLLNRG